MAREGRLATARAAQVTRSPIRPVRFILPQIEAIALNGLVMNGSRNRFNSPDETLVMPVRGGALTKWAWAGLFLVVFTIPWENVLVIPGIGTTTRITGALAVGICVIAVLARR